MNLPAKILDSADYWALRNPYDQYLPEEESSDQVYDELDLIQARFRTAVADLGIEGDTYEFPGHNQMARVFYVYIHSAAFYTPALAQAVATAMDGFTLWIAELECYSAPGVEEGDMLIPVYLEGCFYLDASDHPTAFVSALQLVVA